MQPSDESIPLRDRLTYPLGANEEKYPYDEWFDGSVWKLKMYEDFFVHPGSMRSALYHASRKRGLKVKVHLPTTEDTVYVQVITNE